MALGAEGQTNVAIDYRSLTTGSQSAFVSPVAPQGRDPKRLEGTDVPVGRKADRTRSKRKVRF